MRLQSFPVGKTSAQASLTSQADFLQDTHSSGKYPQARERGMIWTCTHTCNDIFSLEVRIMSSTTLHAIHDLFVLGGGFWEEENTIPDEKLFNWILYEQKEVCLEGKPRGKTLHFLPLLRKAWGYPKEGSLKLEHYRQGIWIHVSARQSHKMTEMGEFTKKLYKLDPLWNIKNQPYMKCM